MNNKQNKITADIIIKPDTATIICQGAWILHKIKYLANRLSKITWPSSKQLTIEGSSITHMDTSGAWFLQKILQQLAKNGYAVTLEGFTPEHAKLIAMVGEQASSITPPQLEPSESWLSHLGRWTVQAVNQLIDYLAFVGEIALVGLRSFKYPLRMHWPYFFKTLESAGYQALPIIALLSFMIGVVLSYQIGLQLRNYGAHIFIVDLLGGSILREFGSLLTAIMVAGRSGSAFTAQLGTMKLNEEIDALSTMGLVPTQLLVLPRLIGLFLVMPLLTIWADFFGILGGMLMAQGMFSIGIHDFLLRFQHQVTINSLIIGLAKAPVFALIIASIGCFQGMQVSGGAESVGQRTTKSVVQGIFMIIVVDAMFSVIFSRLSL